MSNRLDSLNSRKGKSDPKPSLKFKPKVVARKSKEERAKESQVQVKEEPSSFRQNTKGRGLARGRGSTRGRGRGGRADYSGTHVVASGPLMSGSVSIGNVGNTSTAINRDFVSSHSSTPEFFQNLKRKKDYTPKSFSPDDSDSENDSTRIDMNKEYQFADEDTILFPVRAQRIEENEENTASIEVSKDPTPHPGSVYHSTANTPVKSEPLEVELDQIREHKAKLENKIAEPTNLLDQKEHDKMLNDYEGMLSLVTDKVKNLSTDSDPNEKMILFHLPKVLPEYSKESRNENVKTEESDVMLVQNEQDSEKRSSLKGQIGQLNIHQSGKISIDLGNQSHLSLSRGLESNFLQEVMILDVNQESENSSDMVDESIYNRIYCIGDIQDKIIATPSFT